MKECPICYGRGLAQDDKSKDVKEAQLWKRCDACNSTGRVTKIMHDVLVAQLGDDDA